MLLKLLFISAMERLVDISQLLPIGNIWSPHVHTMSTPCPHPMCKRIDTSEERVQDRIMPYRITPLINGQVYHIFNRGVEKRNVFTNRREYAHFLEAAKYYRQASPRVRFSKADNDREGNLPDNKLVEVVAYCLMPNHFHFLLKQTDNNGISTFMRKLINSYTRYFNTRNDRIGSLFQGPFKAIRIESDEQLVHVTRYIHLNPLVGSLAKDLRSYGWSSYLTYVGLKGDDKLCNKKEIEKLVFLGNYEKFVQNQADYAKQLSNLKHLAFDLKD